MPFVPPVASVVCPWCSHAWGGRDTFAGPGVFVPQHKCSFRQCGRWFAVLYRVALVQGPGGAADLQVLATVEGVGRSYGPGLEHLLDTLVTFQRTPGCTLTDYEIRVALACATALAEAAA